MFVVCTLGLISVSHAQTDTTFTYQGELNKLGAPVNGACDFRFQLYDAMSGGSQVSGVVQVSPVNVTDGRFSVNLDFGAEVFDGAQRWLSIDVRQPAGSGTYSTLTPRQPITHSPYSIQTRGIFVDQNKNVGIRTESPVANLHIDGTNSSAVGFEMTAPGDATGKIQMGSPRSHTAIAGTSNNGKRRDIWFMDQGLGLFTSANGSSPFGGTGLFINEQGEVGIGTIDPGTNLDVAGDAIIRDRLGVGNPSSTFGQLTIANAGAPFGLEVYSSNSALPTIYASNSNSGPALWALGTDDASLNGGGLIIAGAESGQNISIDQNEIMARNNGAASTLHLNAEGGQINMGAYDIHPALAYGRVDSTGQIISATPNVVSSQRLAEGSYAIKLADGGSHADVMLVTTWSSVGSYRWDPLIDAFRVVTRDFEFTETIDDDFAFVVYRP